jgi:hypothetical protein
MAEGAPSHIAHTLNMLLRVLGVPMMSNRYDRDNYITINWNRVKQGKYINTAVLPKEIVKAALFMKKI